MRKMECMAVVIIAIGDIYKFSISVHFVFEDQTTHLLTVTFSQVLTQRNILPLCTDELESDHFDALSPVEEKERLRVFDEIGFNKQT
jgi:hypothetical protein